ncbi:MAG: winged helix-turn-helix transcriptional regulator [Candidatus Methanoperedenaceae archaeon]|nr:winged helix-turn-helix transcriptional regulator [Candidatus Methanoperedenaceae archaeon]
MNVEPLSDDIFYIETLYSKNAGLMASEISNDVARMILKELYNNPLSITDISNKLNIPMSTVQYHIDKLIDLSVVKVAKKRLGKRLRDVKMYVYDKESIIFLSSMEKNEFNYLLKTFAFKRIKEKAPIMTVIIFMSGLIISLFGSWLLKKEIENVYSLSYIGGISGATASASGEIEINVLLAFICIFFLLGSAISIILILLVIRLRK